MSSSRQTPRHLKRSPDCRLCVFIAVMLEFPMVWQWWLALGRTIHCIQLHQLSPLKTFQPFSWVCRQRLVPYDLQWSADCLLHLPERADLRLFQHLLTSFIPYLNQGMYTKNSLITPKRRFYICHFKRLLAFQSGRVDRQPVVNANAMRCSLPVNYTKCLCKCASDVTVTA